MSVLLFSGASYYPGGGWQDYIGEFSSVDEAKQAVRDDDWAHIVDRDTLEIVASYLAPLPIHPDVKGLVRSRLEEMNERRGWR